MFSDVLLLDEPNNYLVSFFGDRSWIAIGY
jgi:hypothetical protein